MEHKVKKNYDFVESIVKLINLVLNIQKSFDFFILNVNITAYCILQGL